MIGILIVTHGNLGVEIIKSAELIMGKQERIDSLTLNFGDNIDCLKDQINEKIDSLSSDKNEVIVLTDLYGGSPSNAVLYNFKNFNFQSITGVNLPMLLELLTQRKIEKDLNKVIDSVLDAGVSGIKSLNEEMKKR